jgi:hypothetical protein
MPREHIAFIHDYDSDIAKSKLFDAVNNGQIRVLLGSTMKMGAGTNVQRKLVALHHLDAPWKPADLEQREGRIIRQGNEFYEADPDGFEIEINRYATKQTYDSRMWEIIERKAAAIEAFKDANGARELEDVSSESANAAEMKAGASGNPLILEGDPATSAGEEAGDAEARVRAGQVRPAGHGAPREGGARATRGPAWTPCRSAKAAKPKPKEDAPLGLKMGGKVFDSRKDLPMATLAAEMVSAAEGRAAPASKVGEYRGFDIRPTSGSSGSGWQLNIRLSHETCDRRHAPTATTTSSRRRVSSRAWTTSWTASRRRSSSLRARSRRRAPSEGRGAETHEGMAARRRARRAEGEARPILRDLRGSVKKQAPPAAEAAPEARRGAGIHHDAAGARVAERRRSSASPCRSAVANDDRCGRAPHRA